MLGPNHLADGPMRPASSHPGWRRLRRGAVRWGIMALLVMALVVAHRPLLIGFGAPVPGR